MNSLFIGQRPPANIPLFTNDPFLPCSSRRIQTFEIDAVFFKQNKDKLLNNFRDIMTFGMIQQQLYLDIIYVEYQIIIIFLNHLIFVIRTDQLNILQI